MNEHDRITELLRNYRSYRYAVNNGIAPFVETDMSGIMGGCGFGPRIPRLTAGTTFQSEQDYHMYKRIVEAIDGAVKDVLSDDQGIVIRLKYLERNPTTLLKIAIARDKDEKTIRRWHKEAIKLLGTALEFVETPEIINLDFSFKKPAKRKINLSNVR